MRPKIEYKVVHNGSEYTFASNGIELDNLVCDLVSKRRGYCKSGDHSSAEGRDHGDQMTNDKWKRDLWATCEPTEVSAIQELESRGLVFCAHFGTANAMAVLEDMNHAVETGTMYEWMRDNLGIITTPTGDRAF